MIKILKCLFSLRKNNKIIKMSKKKFKKIYKLIDWINIKLGLKFMTSVRKL